MTTLTLPFPPPPLPPNKLIVNHLALPKAIIIIMGNINMTTKNHFLQKRGSRSKIIS